MAISSEISQVRKFNPISFSPKKGELKYEPVGINRERNIMFTEDGKIILLPGKSNPKYEGSMTTNSYNKNGEISSDIKYGNKINYFG